MEGTEKQTEETTKEIIQKTVFKCEQCNEEIPIGDAARCQFCGKPICEECDVHIQNDNLEVYACSSHVLKVKIPRDYKEKVVRKIMGKLAASGSLDSAQKEAFAAFLKGEVDKIREGGW